MCFKSLRNVALKKEKKKRQIEQTVVKVEESFR